MGDRLGIRDAVGSIFDPLFFSNNSRKKRERKKKNIGSTEFGAQSPVWVRTTGTGFFGRIEKLEVSFFFIYRKLCLFEKFDPSPMAVDGDRGACARAPAK